MAWRRLEQEDAEVGRQPRYPAFAEQINKALAGFERAREWADLITCLQKLSKALGRSAAPFVTVPSRLLLGRRLAQCLNAALPSGVHLEALETYELLFHRIGGDRLARDLAMYCFGMFALLPQASTLVRPALLRVFEKYLVPLGPRLGAALQGLLVGLLPVAELEPGATPGQALALLDSLSSSCSAPLFPRALWRTLLRSRDARRPAALYLALRIPGDTTAEVWLPEREILVCAALSHALADETALTVRAVLDLLVQRFPLSAPPLAPAPMQTVLQAALEALSRRDGGVARRVHQWLLGKSESDAAIYMEQYSKPLVTGALEALFDSADASPAIPFRLLLALMERAELNALGECVFLPALRLLDRSPPSADSLASWQRLADALGPATIWSRLTSLLAADPTPPLASAPSLPPSSPSFSRPAAVASTAPALPVVTLAIPPSRLPALLLRVLDAAPADAETRNTYLPSFVVQLLALVTALVTSQRQAEAVLWAPFLHKLIPLLEQHSPPLLKASDEALHATCNLMSTSTTSPSPPLHAPLLHVLTRMYKRLSPAAIQTPPDGPLPHSLHDALGLLPHAPRALFITLVTSATSTSPPSLCLVDAVLCLLRSPSVIPSSARSYLLTSREFVSAVVCGLWATADREVSPTDSSTPEQDAHLLARLVRRARKLHGPALETSLASRLTAARAVGSLGRLWLSVRRLHLQHDCLPLTPLLLLGLLEDSVSSTQFPRPISICVTESLKANAGMQAAARAWLQDASEEGQAGTVIAAAEQQVRQIDNSLLSGVLAADAPLEQAMHAAHLLTLVIRHAPSLLLSPLATDKLPLEPLITACIRLLLVRLPSSSPAPLALPQRLELAQAKVANLLAILLPSLLSLVPESTRVSAAATEEAVLTVLIDTESALLHSTLIELLRPMVLLLASAQPSQSAAALYLDAALRGLRRANTPEQLQWLRFIRDALAPLLARLPSLLPPLIAALRRLLEPAARTSVDLPPLLSTLHATVMYALKGAAQPSVTMSEEERGKGGFGSLIRDWLLLSTQSLPQSPPAPEGREAVTVALPTVLQLLADSPTPHTMLLRLIDDLAAHLALPLVAHLTLMWATHRARFVAALPLLPSLSLPHICNHASSLYTASPLPAAQLVALLDIIRVQLTPATPDHISVAFPPLISFFNRLLSSPPTVALLPSLVLLREWALRSPTPSARSELYTLLNRLIAACVALTTRGASSEEESTILRDVCEALPNALDAAYEEKDKAASALAPLLAALAPSLKKPPAEDSRHTACVSLLCALSEHALWLPSWRAYALETFTSDTFFSLLIPAHAPLWGKAINVLFSRDKQALADLLHGTARVSGGLFSGAKESEIERARAKQVRRLAFMLWAGQFEQYAQHLPQLEERLVELARSAAEAASFRALFLALRLLLCRIATQRLRSFWPFVLTEMMRVLDSARANDSTVALAAAQFAELAQLLAPNAFAAFEWMFAAYSTADVSPAAAATSSFVPLIELLAPAPASSANLASLPTTSTPLLQRHPLLAPATETGEGRTQLGEFSRKSYAAMLAVPLQVQDAQLDALFVVDFCRDKEEVTEVK